jgi:hypothetical protein
MMMLFSLCLFPFFSSLWDKKLADLSQKMLKFEQDGFEIPAEGAPQDDLETF